MDEGFSADDEDCIEDGYRVLPPSSKSAMYLGNLIWFCILAAVLGVARAVMPCFPGREVVRISLLVLLAAVGLYLLVAPAVFYNHYRYRIDGDKVEVRRGVLTIRHVLVPVERIHQVEVSRGPINRHYGLAEVDITTAGGEVAIEYLEESVAEGIATKLNDSVVGILRKRV